MIAGSLDADAVQASGAMSGPVCGPPAMLRHGVAVITRLDGRDRIAFVSDALARWLDLPEAALLDGDLGALLAPASAAALGGAIGRVLAAGGQIQLMAHCLGPRAPTAQLLVTALGADGSPERAVTVLFLDPPPELDSADADMLPRLLQQAIVTSQLTLLFQPIADLADGSIVAHEALLRWRSPHAGMLSPGSFLAHAEALGLASALTYWTVEHALLALRGWDEAGLAPTRIAVNVSPAQLADPDLPLRVADALARTGIAPGRVTIEVSEAALTGDAQAAAHALGRLRAVGVAVALDDFGTGFSSLNHLKRLPFDVVKIDNALVARIERGGVDADTVRTVIDMAHQMGLRVSAEGVENEVQCAFLVAHGCDALQGNFLGLPRAADACAEALRAGAGLPPQLVRKPARMRTLLLVDDEVNVISSLRRLLRRDGYQILSANGGQEALALLAAHPVDVIVSDQRMPGMTGTEFLHTAHQRFPDTVRIMLSGYTELQAVTDSVNSGAIYKFLTKPWDDEQLRTHIAAAFRLKTIADENQSLSHALRKANQDLARANREMEALMRQMEQQISHDATLLGVARELLEFVPMPVLGVDTDGVVAFANAAASALFEQRRPLLGSEAAQVLPELHASEAVLEVNGACYAVERHRMGAKSDSRGTLITMRRCNEVTV